MQNFMSYSTNIIDVDAYHHLCVDDKTAEYLSTSGLFKLCLFKEQNLITD